MQNIFTIDGYTELFGTCEKNCDIYQRLAKEIDFHKVNDWRDFVPPDEMTPSVKYLFTFWNKNCDDADTLEKKELRQFLELFSLLENVFRNTLLRPYIPAYRTINMNCGRYRSSHSEVAEKLFERLKFRKNSENLLTYVEEDPKQTIVYALTCYVFWHLLSMHLPNSH